MTKLFVEDAWETKTVPSLDYEYVMDLVDEFCWGTGEGLQWLYYAISDLKNNDLLPCSEQRDIIPKCSNMGYTSS